MENEIQELRDLLLMLSKAAASQREHIVAQNETINELTTNLNRLTQAMTQHARWITELAEKQTNHGAALVLLEHRIDALSGTARTPRTDA